MREAHRVLLDSLEPEGKVLFFQAPTGYGKTSFTPTLYEEIGSIGGPPALIHVLPLKAIVEQAYHDFKGELKDVNVGVQVHGVVEGKAPYLASPLTVTTFDSFTLNLIGANVAERGIGHYLVPKAMIASSTVVLDEAHLPLYSGDDHYATSMLAEVYTLASWRNPVIVETATLPAHTLSQAIRQLPSRLRVEVEVVEPVPENAVDKCSNNYNNIGIRVNCVPDPEYYEKAESVEWRYERLPGEPLQTVASLAQTGLRVFRAVDSVRRAISEYKELVGTLGSGNVALLHSRLTPIDRSEQLEKARRGAQVLVGTSAVEAGVNVSYDALVTDIPLGDGAPLSLLQRMGRVNRYNESPIATIYLADTPLRDELISYLVRVKPNPRVPYDTGRTRGFKELLDEFSKPPTIKVDSWYTVRKLALRSLKPYEVLEALKSAIKEACGLIREALLVPITPNPGDLGLSWDELIEDAPNYIFPVDHSLLPKIAWRNNGKIRALVVEADKSRGHPYKRILSIKEVEEPSQGCRAVAAHMLKHGIAAYIASPGLYKPGIGLLAGQSKGGTPSA